MLSELVVLRDVCARLEKANFAYLLRGSMALNVMHSRALACEIDLVAGRGAFVRYKQQRFSPMAIIKAVLARIDADGAATGAGKSTGTAFVGRVR